MDDENRASDFFEIIINAIPSPILLVDSDLRIQQINLTASNHLGLNIHDIYNVRGGEALHCVHSTEDPKGCGHAEACKDCIIRGSANRALQGNTVYRKQSRMQLKTADKIEELHLLVTASPFEFQRKSYVLLVLDDITELIQLRSILPICCNCKRIRHEQEYWQSVEEYLSSHIDIEFSHALCPDCANKLYPNIL